MNNKVSCEGGFNLVEVNEQPTQKSELQALIPACLPRRLQSVKITVTVRPIRGVSNGGFTSTRSPAVKDATLAQ
jgi:hypothetical protein